MKRLILLLMGINLILFGCAGDDSSTQANEDENTQNLQFAVISDSHIEDISMDLQTDYKGAELNGELYTIRPMIEQLTSTRLFNENYFALKQSLDDIAKQEIKTVVFTGDMTDDGQEVSIAEFTEILDEYHQKYDMDFYVLPGNHDPTSPYGKGEGDNFLTTEGEIIDLYASGSEECQEQDAQCDPAMAGIGQEQMIEMLGEYGFKPKEDNLLWATPFSTYDFTEYSYEQAKSEANADNRSYQSCNENNECKDVYDLSYVVESVPGYLFLMIDANVFLPDTESDEFASPSDKGWNYIGEYKPHLLDFIKDVNDYANETNKQVIMFNHYPVADFYKGMYDQLAPVFGEDGLYFSRLPNEESTEMLANTGIQLVFSGHMHYNDSAVYEQEDNYLVDVSVPSTAGYAPAYKVVSSDEHGVYQIETKVLDDVKDFDKFFPLYEKEYQKLEENGGDADGLMWSLDALDVENYREFTKYHIEYLTENNHFSKWPTKVQETFNTLNLYELLIYPKVGKQFTPDEFVTALDAYEDVEITDMSEKADTYFATKQITKEELQAVKGLDVVTAFYKFLSGDELAYDDYTQKQKDIIESSLEFYRENESSDVNQEYTEAIDAVITAIDVWAHDLPSANFTVDLNSHQVNSM